MDADGKPLVVYHGTTADFDEFAATPSAMFQDDEGRFFFTDNPGSASDYAEHPLSERMGGGAVSGSNVRPVFLAIRNPYTEEIDGDPVDYYDQHSWSMPSPTDADRHDGIVIRDTDSGESLYVAFSPAQIKSSTGNRGTFDPKSAKITESEESNDGEV